MPQRRIIKKANGITRTATNTEIKSPDRPPSGFSRSAGKCNSITVPRTFNYYSGLGFLQYLGSLHLAKSSGHRCRRCDPPRYYKFRKGLLEHQRLHHPPADWNEEDVQKFMESRTPPSPKPLKSPRGQAGLARRLQRRCLRHLGSLHLQNEENTNLNS